MIKLSALGSGSRGNAIIVSCDDGALIVDVGFSRKEVFRRMTELDLHPERLRAALLTHEHDDHCKGCRVFCNNLDIPLYTTARTANFLRKKEKLPKKICEFEPGCSFDAAGFTVSPFSVQHDACDPVGFVLTRGNVKIGIATDLGDVNALASAKLRDCDCLVLESNYDRTMLLNSDRRLDLKRRILGRQGHLDNVDAAAALGTLLTDRTKILLLAHLSHECNSRELVEHIVHERLHELHRDDLHFQPIDQNEPAGPFILE